MISPHARVRAHLFTKRRRFQRDRFRPVTQSVVDRHQVVESHLQRRRQRIATSLRAAAVRQHLVRGRTSASACR
jgi:hypothetical protein